MTPTQLLQHFDRLSEAPGAIPRLRRFILDLAVRGKLVEQNPNDEPAAELLKRIQMEKAILKNEGNLRKIKVLEDISDEDIEFEIPRNWIGSRLGNIYDVRDGTHDTPKYVDLGFPLVTSKNLSSGKLSFDDIKLISEQDHRQISSRSRVEKDDILLAMIGSIGNPVVVDTDREFSIKNVALFKYYDRATSCPGFLCLYLRYAASKMQQLAAGGLQPFVSLGFLRNYSIALPPLAEQHRIVAKVNELMALCDQLETAKIEREQSRDRLLAANLHHLNHPSEDEETFRDHVRFTFNHLPRITTRPAHIKQLRQTILNLAVRGKLVPQDPNDEPAAELLKRIRVENGMLFKDGAKKNKTVLPDVDLEQAPFALPLGWSWARFPELGKFGRGKSKHRPRNDSSLFEGGTHLLVQTGDVARSQGVIQTYTNKYNDVGLAQSMKWPSGTLCITIAANIADSGILSFDACFPDSVVGFVPASMFQNARYFEYFVRTAKANLLEFAPATAQKNINLEILNSVLIPLPPLAEQHRIVAKVDELMTICDQLETQLNTTDTDSRRLLEAVLHEALAPALEKAA